MAKIKLKKRGPKEGIKRGPYKKTNQEYKDEYSKTETKPIEEIEDNNSHQNFRNNLDVEKSESHIDEKKFSEKEREDLINDANLLKEKVENDLPPENTFTKSGEELFNDFKNSFERQDINKINDAKDRIDESAEKLKQDAEKNNKDNNPNDSGNSEKRKYTRRGSYNQDEKDIKDSVSTLVNGSMLISLMDFVFPNMIKFIYTRFLKNKTAEKITHSELVMSLDQKESLGEIPDKVARIIFEKVNPVILFFIFYAVMSFMNFQMALDNHKKLEKLEGGKK